MNKISINGTPLTGIYVDASESFDKPEKRVENIQIAGRNGDLIIDDGTFENVVIKYPCFERGTFPTNFDQIVNTLAAADGYVEISVSNDTAHYRLGRFLTNVSPTVRRLNKDGYFDLSFDCKPQRFLVSGKTAQTFNASGTINNPTAWASQPLIRVYGTGVLTVGGVAITISVNADYTDIDCEQMDCYKGTTNLNANVNFSGNDFPTLAAGSNTVTLGAGITQVIITPKFWEL